MPDADGVRSRLTGKLHRLDKVDTRNGLASLQPIADLGVPYAMLLYERFLGRPFAGHRDSVSELVGDVLESAIELMLSSAGITFRKTRRAERVTNFDQAPDFIVPDEFAPHIVIEAKITEDDGTARDKVTRVQHLGALSMAGRQPHEPPKYEVVACIAGRGFGVRREDMKKLLLLTRGKVFTLQNIPQLVDLYAIGGVQDAATRAAGGVKRYRALCRSRPRLRYWRESPAGWQALPSRPAKWYLPKSLQPPVRVDRRGP